MTNLANACRYLYGIDIGGTKIEIAIFTHQLELVTAWRIATPTHCYNEFLNTIADLIEQADQQYPAKDAAKDTTNLIGIGVPGINDPQGHLLCANIPCLNGKHFTFDIKQKLERPVVVAKDSHLFALSEAVAGAGQTTQRVFGAILGTGVAGGVCQEGKLITNRQNLLGEFGHLAAPASVINHYQLPLHSCGCGLSGCYETYLSGAGLANLYQSFGGAKADTYAFSCALSENESAAQQTFACYMQLLGAAMANIVLQHDPDMIIIGGGLSNIDEIITALPKAMANFLFTGVQVPIIKKAQFGDTSGVRGAALLALQHEGSHG